MKKNIFIYFIILIIIAISITGFFISQLVQKNYNTDAEEKLIHLTKIIEVSLEKIQASSGTSINYDALAKEYADILDKSYFNNSISQRDKNSRITFISTDGKVLGDSAADYQKMENHLNRKEVQDAINGKTGLEMRYSSTLKMNFIYSAVLLPSHGVVVRVSMPLKNLQDINKQIWGITLLGILAGLFLAGLLAFKFSTFIVTPIDNHIQAINKELFLTVDDLKDKNVKMDAILNSMGSGIIAVDSDMRIMLFNSRAFEFFAVNDTSSIIGKSIIELIRNAQISDYLTSTINENHINTGEIHIFSPVDRIIRVITAPIKAKDDKSVTSGGIVVFEDITNLKKLEQIRTDFVSNVTHELKTPLTSIKGFIETLKNGAIEEKELATRFLDIIDIEAERLTILINDILYLSEIESKQKDTNIYTYAINDIINEIVPIMEEVASRKNIKINWNIDSSIIIEVNKDRIKQILINLIDNAIKYNMENGQIYVSIKKNASGVEMSIKDTGIGIADENLLRIFERFYRVDKGRSRSMGGTGLGLSIVKHIVNLYNGDIKINSTVGKGTEFIINLPVVYTLN